MLLLARKTNEKIVIGDEITIEVLAVTGNKVRLGIIAPSDVQVHREEVYEAIQRSKKNNGNEENPKP